MIVKPRVRAFVCVTAHPEGCAAHVREQIEVVRQQGAIANGPKKVLVIGASTGYGLASRITAAFGAGADTVGVFFERPSTNGKTATPGWYNTAAFEAEAQKAGLKAVSLNGDAFSRDLKAQTIEAVREHLGKVDLVVYSLAAPRRTDPETGEVFKSALKPIGRDYSNKYLDTDKRAIDHASLEAATDEEIRHTVKVMGGEDWRLWIEALDNANLLAEGCQTVAYDYIGPKVTWPIYKDGTIGQAKKDLRMQAASIDDRLRSSVAGHAYVSVNKAIVTQASAAIPGVNLYITMLFKQMKEKGGHEGAIEQINRLFRERLYTGEGVPLDEQGLIRIDDLEMRPEIQQAIAEAWPKVSTETLDQYCDFAAYQRDFLRLFGFEIEGVDYTQDVEIEVPIPSLQS
ncbi:MAG: enoyl-ACP reductase FabV [Verrucomicrobiota bacterium]